MNHCQPKQVSPSIIINKNNFLVTLKNTSSMAAKLNLISVVGVQLALILFTITEIHNGI